MDFGAIINRSKDVTLKNKWLWVYGLVITALTGSGFSSGGGGGSSSSSSSSTKNLPKDLPEQGKKVLGDSVSYLSTWLSSVPVQTWVFLGLGVLLLLVFVITINWIALAWAKGALIGGLNDALEDKKVDLKNTTGYGLKSLKNLVSFGVINSLISLGTIFTILVVYGLLALIFSFAQPLMVLWLIVAGILGFFTIVILMVVIAMVGVYAERLIVLKGLSPWEAWKKGLAMGKGNFLNTVLMGVINSTTGCMVGCLSSIILLLALAIPGIILAIPFFYNSYPPVSIIGLLLLVGFFIYANFLIRAGMVVFTYSNWNQTFKHFYEK